MFGVHETYPVRIYAKRKQVVHLPIRKTNWTNAAVWSTVKGTIRRYHYAKKYPHLFAPLTVGGVTYKNRIFQAPATPIVLQQDEPYPTQECAYCHPDCL